MSMYLFNTSCIVPQILAFGVTMILIGVSARVNSDLIYMMMYDSYYLGMEELLLKNQGYCGKNGYSDTERHP